MDLEHMKEFIVFSQHLNVTRAARELLMTQSNLSKHIKQMERELGFRLIKRADSRVTLTHEGERFLSMCHDFTDSYAVLVSECRTSQHMKHEALVGQDPSYSDATGEAYYRLIGELVSTVPEIEIRFVQPYRKVISDELSSGRLDLGILYRARSDDDDFLDRVSSKSLGAIPLVDDDFAVWCHQSHPLARLEGVTLADLCAYQIMQPNDVYTPLRRLLMHYSEREGLRLKFKMVESDQATMFLSMRYPDCVYVLPQSVQSDLRVVVRKEMVFRPMIGDDLGFTSYLVARRELFESHAALRSLFAPVADKCVGLEALFG